MTSSQKAIMALEVERRLAEEARVRRLAGLKQNQGSDVLRNQFPNGDNTPSGNYFPNGDNTPSGNGFIKGQASIQAAAEAGTNRKYVDAAKKISRQAPELLDPIRDGLITIPQARKITGLSVQQRATIIEKIKSGEALTVASAILQLPQEETNPEDSNYGSGWTRQMYQIRVFLNSLRDHGGMAQLCRRWPKRVKRGHLAELREARRAINQCIEYLEKELA